MSSKKRHCILKKHGNFMRCFIKVLPAPLHLLPVLVVVVLQETWWREKQLSSNDVASEERKIFALTYAGSLKSGELSYHNTNIAPCFDRCFC